MKLIAEQVKYLREKKQELLKKRAEYTAYCKSRDSVASDWNSISPMVDYQEDAHMSKAIDELHRIDDVLKHSEFVVDRNFDQVDIGTRFSVRFEDEDKESIILTESNNFASGYGLVSLNSDLGKAVLGHKKGDQISFKVSSTGRKINVSIDDIDTMKENYEHFLCEVPYSNRGSSAQRKKLTILNREGNNDSNHITLSQEELLKEEIYKLNHGVQNNSTISKKAQLKKVLETSPIAQPKGDTIGIGSQVQVLIKDGDKEYLKSFEFINRAYTTELESHYVERTSALGNALYGLKEGDTFKVLNWDGKAYTGVVSTVVNDKNKERVR